MISCRQPLIFLHEATEIRVNYDDIERLKDFVTEEWTCTADVVIYLPREQLIDWDIIDIYKNVLKLTLAVEDTSQIGYCIDRGYKVFWAYPVSSFWELRSVLSLGVSQVLLDAPLYFDLPKVKNLCGDDVEIRLVVNKCYNEHLPHENGICGTYIRPEDIEEYSNFVDHFEFEADNKLSKEHTLYNIYVKDKEWPGDLDVLLNNFGVSVDNRGFDLISEEDEKMYAHRRMTCGQKCQSISYCNFCPQHVDFINTVQRYAVEQREKEKQEELEKNNQIEEETVEEQQS